MDPSNSTFNSLDYVLERPKGLPALTVDQLAVVMNHLGYLVMDEIQYIGGRQLRDDDPRSQLVASLLPDEIKKRRMLSLLHRLNGPMLYLTDGAQWLYVKPDSVVDSSSLILAHDDHLMYRDEVPKQLLELIHVAKIGESNLRYVIRSLASTLGNASDLATRRAARLTKLSAQVQAIVDRNDEIVI